MDFKDSIKQLADNVERKKDRLQTEEATKNALIMPFLSVLGYDVSNPTEVVPEFTCDIGTKKGEKVDYAIFRDESPAILIECKHCNKDLNLHDSQLLRYYHVSKAKFGILTNGVIYRFYTDLEATNKMDEKPFLEINLLDVKPPQIEELKKFHKTCFDENKILSFASELKYTSDLKTILNSEFDNPTRDFVKLLAKQVYSGTLTPKILEQFTVLVKKSALSIISDRPKSALNTEQKEQQKVEEPEQKESINGSAIQRTNEEIEAFYIVKSILRKTIKPDRITHGDSKRYLAIFIDNSNRKRVCRLYLNSPTNKRITFFDENRKKQHNKIGSVDEIYDYSERLINTVNKFL